MRVAMRKKELIFPPDLSLFHACHASTFVAAPNGDYLVAYFAGEREGLPDTGIWLSEFRRGAWLPPRKLMYDGTPHWNPVLFCWDGTVYLFYKKGLDTHVWETYCSTSEDSGVTWSESRLLCPEDPCSRGPVRNKLLIGRDGSWIAPGSVETDIHFDSFVEKSFDQGITWTRHAIPISHRSGSPVCRKNLWEGLIRQELWENDISAVEKWDGIIQPSLWYSEDGTLHAFPRSTGGHIYRSDSPDDGETWCEAYETDLPNNNAGLDAVKLPDGKLALVCNPIFGNWARRTPISLLLSSDDGDSFGTAFPLETLEGELSYPSVNVVNGTLHITFTFLRKSIMHCECDILD